MSGSGSSAGSGDHSPARGSPYVVAASDGHDAEHTLNAEELHLLKEWVHRQTLHDQQTGLPNRQYLRTRLEELCGRCDPSAVVTLLYLDLDGFAVINDGLGHHCGDQLLAVVAGRLQKVVADQPAMVARVGDDEYAILIEPTGSVPDVAALAEAVNTALAEPTYLDGAGAALSATIGIVQRPVAGAEPAELIRAAAATLRRTGTRQWAMFDPDADATERAELRLAATLPGALEAGDVQVQYQPVVTLDRGRLVAVEAVLSWQHPRLGVLSHDRCMQLAERTGAVHAVGRCLLRTAAQRALSWQRLDPDPPPVVINLTLPQAQHPDLVGEVGAVLAETGLPPSGLELRMPVQAIRTVSGLPAGRVGEDAEDNLQVLAALGVRMGLHDFAGGIGALRLLADLPVGVVRVAEPVSRQVVDDRSRILSEAVQALTRVVRAAGINVVAYPVEISAQVACWRWVGANWAVGPLFGRPGPPEEIERLFEAKPGSLI